ncbi:checkpoint protein Rad24p [Monosporozyma servazzii]
MTRNGILLRSSSFLESQTKLWESTQPPENQNEGVTVKIRPNTRKYHSLGPSDISNIKNKEDEIVPDIGENLPWYEKYAPKTLPEIAIHKRKLKDVEEALSDMLSNTDNTRLLLLSGPSGCCKSTLIKGLSKTMVPLYRNSNASTMLNQYSLNINTGDGPDYVVEYENSLQLSEMNNMEAFNEFLQRSKFYNGAYNLSVLLVDDLPNVFHYETRLQFQKIIKEWLYTEGIRLPPLVVCLTECEIEEDNNKKSENVNGGGININNTYTAETVFNKEILQNPKLKRIKFNPINNTLMKKLLNNIALEERAQLEANGKWKFKDEYITKLLKSNNGDIRSMISSFQFWATSKDSNGLSDTNAIDNIYLRTESVSFFHGVGKVIYGSHEKDGSLIDDNEMINRMLDINGDSNTNLLFNDNFKLGLLENYNSFNKNQLPIDVAAKIVMSLSDNNSLFGSSNNFEGLEYMIRKIRYETNKYSKGKDFSSGVHGGFNFPREWKCRQRKQRFKIESQDLQNVSFYKYGDNFMIKDVALCLGYYSPLIRKQQNYRMKALSYYLKNSGKISKNRSDDPMQVNSNIDILERIGGPFKSDYDASKDIKTEDDIKIEAEKSINSLIRKKDERLAELIQQYERRNMFNSDEFVDIENDEYMDDPLVDSEQDVLESLLADSDDDDDDDAIYEALSQQPPSSTTRNNSPTKPLQRTNTNTDVDKKDDSLSDSDLENLL